MKQLTLTIITVFTFVFFTSNIYAQAWTNTPPGGTTGVGLGIDTEILYVNPINTSVGIGTTSPASNYSLTVKGGAKRGIYATGTSYAAYFNGNIGLTGNIRGLENTGIFGIYANSTDKNGPYFKLYGKNNSSRPGGMTICAYQQGTIEFFSRTATSWNKHMTIFSTGKIGVGTDNTPTTIGNVNIDNYRLFVKGGILTDELRVRTGWADYVFEDAYQLKSLSEVEAHIEEKGYLHNTPSAEEVETEGIEIGEITKNQQEKIEEVFLHLISLEKRIDQLANENSALKKALNEKK